MKEKVRLMQDGDRLLILIEEVTPDLKAKVQQILFAAIDSVEGLDKPKPETAPSVQIPPKEEDARGETAEQQTQNSDSEPKKESAQKKTNLYIFPSGQHKGKTVLSVVESGDFKYIHFLLCSTTVPYREGIWNDLLENGRLYAEALRKKHMNDPKKVLALLFDVLDHMPNATPLSPNILSTIGISSVEELIKSNNSMDIEYAFTGVLEYLERQGKRRERK